jgi:ubiquinone/menaquinone biosynthesis C-methylase UbiE
MIYYPSMSAIELQNRPDTTDSHFNLYTARMNQAKDDKYLDISPALKPVLEQFGQPTIVSVGAGGGKFEEKIARIAPHACIVASDLSMRMEKTIWELADTEERRSGLRSLETFAGRAQHIPLADNSVEVVFAISVGHHLGSFEDGFSLGADCRLFFSEAERVLRPGGRLILRDFMQPDHPEREVLMQVGSKQTQNEMNPLYFLHRFLREYQGMDMTDLRRQMDMFAGQPLKGRAYRIPLALASEIAAHYSWAYPRFTEEVKERYSYLPLNPYADFALGQFGRNGKIVYKEERVLPGYPEHVDGRLDFFTFDGYRIPVPIYTGVFAIEKR